MEKHNFDIQNWNLWLTEVDNIKKISDSEDTVKKYAEEFNLPEELIYYSLKKEKERSVNSKRINDLRTNSGEYVKNATKLYKEGLAAIEKETERADSAELELSAVKRQLEFAMDILSKDGNVSEIELYLSVLEEKTKKSLIRAVQKSLHPDKHPGVNQDTNRALNSFFGIINRIFEKERI